MEPYRATEPPTVVVRNSRAGSIQAIDGAGLVRWAREHDCLLALPHIVGDFLPEGAVVQVYGRVDDPAAAEERLHGMIASDRSGEVRTRPSPSASWWTLP